MLPNIVLFQGQDALNDSGLWETNGTGSGTFELAPAGTGAQGLSPSGITVLGTRVLFEGVDLERPFRVVDHRRDSGRHH